jgi:hypothetical protein
MKFIKINKLKKIIWNHFMKIKKIIYYLINSIKNLENLVQRNRKSKRDFQNV